MQISDFIKALHLAEEKGYNPVNWTARIEVKFHLLTTEGYYPQSYIVEVQETDDRILNLLMIWRSPYLWHYDFPVLLQTDEHYAIGIDYDGQLYELETPDASTN